MKTFGSHTLWLLGLTTAVLLGEAAQSYAQAPLMPLAAPHTPQTLPLPAPDAATDPAKADALTSRATALVPLFRADPGDYETLFAPDFLTQISAIDLSKIFRDYYNQVGRCTGVKLVEQSSAAIGQFNFTFEKGYTVPGTLVLEAEVPHRITGLRFGLPQKAGQTLAQVVDDIKALPGTTSFLFARLNGNDLQPLTTLNEKQPLALGSAFKLYILAELTREVAAGQRHWTDVVYLSKAHASLPSGTLQTWPDGAPVTLHTLATLMISVSDNTATDTLLRTLGREKVESMLKVTGHSQPQLNMPFLSTLEMFRIKADPSGQMAARYESADTATRRALLGNEIPAITRDSLIPMIKPSHISTIEWFASATDLGHVMNWLRLNSVTPTTAPIRGILAVNPGVPVSKRWQYVGYKGGSEPGVLDLTYLLQGTNGQWYVLTATWNNPQAAVDETAFINLVASALEVAPQS